MREFNRIVLILNLVLVPCFVYLKSWHWAAFSFAMFVWCCTDKIVYAIEDNR